jgi:hypothetical protein
MGSVNKNNGHGHGRDKSAAGRHMNVGSSYGSKKSSTIFEDDSDIERSTGAGDQFLNAGTSRSTVSSAGASDSYGSSFGSIDDESSSSSGSVSSQFDRSEGSSSRSKSRVSKLSGSSSAGSSDSSVSSSPLSGIQERIFGGLDHLVERLPEQYRGIGQKVAGMARKQPKAALGIGAVLGLLGLRMLRRR